MLGFVKRGLKTGVALGAALLISACGDDPIEVVIVSQPIGLAGNAVDATTIRITWNPSTNAATYRVEREGAGGTFADIGSTAQTTFDDAGLMPATSYTYRVIGVATDGTESNPSGSITLSTTTTTGAAAVDLIGNITTSRTLYSDTVYTLKGVVQVQPGAVLTIEAGALILGDKATQGTLIVQQGGRIEAVGTATRPIVFTSAAAAGNRQKGDWGGVIINGNSNCNFPAGQCLGEGNTGVYGGSDPNDNSGTLRYVRIEFGGIEFSPDNELNGLTLNGVGAGTTIEYVQAHAGLDDGIEFFGGTVDVRYAVVTLASDDSFDWSTGWQGRGQFWIVQQDPTDGDNGWEIDNNEGDFEALPRTFGQVYNFTSVGKSAADAAESGSDLGILFRRGYAGNHACGVVIGFGKPGLDVDDAATERLASNDSLTLMYTTFFDNGREDPAFASPGVNFDGDTESDGVTTDFEQTWALGAGTGNTEEDPMLADPFNLSVPDFSPMAGSPLLASCGGAVPNDGWFDHTVDYRGAVAGASDTWYRGWTTNEVPN